MGALPAGQATRHPDLAGSGRPLLLFGRPELDPFEAVTWSEFWTKQRGPRLRLELKGSEHHTFTDFSPLVPQLAPILQERTAAVRDLTFTVRPGVVTGFLGPNGAGKSTTMRMLIGLDRPDAGQATVNGRPYRELRRPLREVGAMLEAKSFHPGRSARAHLGALAASNGIPGRRVAEVLALVGLDAVARRRAGKFSLGMAQRLGIAAALLGDPGTVILDEPVNGLDPEGVRWVRDLLKSLAVEGRTVLISSHLISEVAQTADELIVIGQGRLLAQATVAELTARASSLEDAFFQLTASASDYTGRAA
jgi:ABC-2 type transport system ATP-binding protein